MMIKTNHDDNQVGTLYRVLLPHEIPLKQTHDGILLDDVPKKGISKNKRTKSVRSDSEGTENKSADPSKNDITEIDPPLSLKHRN